MPELEQLETRGFSTRISVPSDHARRLVRELTEAGFVVLDRGETITTEDDLDGESTLDILRLPNT